MNRRVSIASPHCPAGTERAAAAVAMAWRASTLRLATIDDLEPVNRLVAASAGSWGLAQRALRLSLPLFSYTADDLRHMTVMLAVDPAGGLKGVAAWEPPACFERSAEDRNLLLHGLFVAPADQRGGVGSRLLEQVVAAARSARLDRVQARVVRAAEAFFGARGFRPVDDAGGDALYPRPMWRPAR